MNDTAPAKPTDKNAVRETMESTYRNARDAASKAIETTRDATRDAVKRTTQSVEANPIAMLAGGIAVGMLAGAFLPHSEQEKKLLGPQAVDRHRGGRRSGCQGSRQGRARRARPQSRRGARSGRQGDRRRAQGIGQCRNGSGGSKQAQGLKQDRGGAQAARFPPPCPCQRSPGRE
jgi:ElaB/YqjD/DUF883 family membrane-anchored ribosome-binding protein